MSADKIQLTLEKLLEDHLPLIHKGIFTEAQLRKIMANRQKHEQNMLTSTHNITSFLSAIQYQYSLERQRKFRVSQYGITNPLFLKHSKTDFIILKRIIQLWNRTTHRYKYRQQLWKQYLDFCLAIASKKHFYKALTNSLRFLPFSQDLWLIGVRYEVQIGKNMWKGRRLFLKAIKINQSSIRLWKNFIAFQIQFVKALLERQEIMIKGEGEKEINFLLGNDKQQSEKDEKNQDEQQNENLKMNIEISKLANYDEVIWLIIEECFLKCKQIPKDQIISNFIQQLQSIGQKETNEQVITIINRLLKKINNLSDIKSKKLYVSQISNKNISIQQFKTQKQPKNKDQLYEYYSKWVSIFNQQNIFNQNILIKAMKSFSLKPHILDQLLVQFINTNFQATFNVLTTFFNKFSLPPQSLIAIIKQQQKRQQCTAISDKFIDWQIKNIKVEVFKDNNLLLKAVIEYNNNFNKIKSNCNIYRTMSVNYGRTHPQVVELCSTWIKNK